MEEGAVHPSPARHVAELTELPVTEGVQFGVNPLAPTHCTTISVCLHQNCCFFSLTCQDFYLPISSKLEHIHSFVLLLSLLSPQIVDPHFAPDIALSAGDTLTWSLTP